MENKPNIQDKVNRDSTDIVKPIKILIAERGQKTIYLLFLKKNNNLTSHKKVKENNNSVDKKRSSYCKNLLNINPFSFFVK